MNQLTQLQERVREFGGSQINLQIWPGIDLVEMAVSGPSGRPVKVSGLSVESAAATMLQRLNQITASAAR